MPSNEELQSQIEDLLGTMVIQQETIEALLDYVNKVHELAKRALNRVEDAVAKKTETPDETTDWPACTGRIKHDSHGTWYEACGELVDPETQMCANGHAAERMA